MLVELEAIERNLVGKSEQDLVMFGAMRDEEGGVKEDSLFSGLDHEKDVWIGVLIIRMEHSG